MNYINISENDAMHFEWCHLSILTNEIYSITYGNSNYLLYFTRVMNSFISKSMQ